MRLRTHHVSHVLSSFAFLGLLLSGPEVGVVPGVVGALGVLGVVGAAGGVCPGSVGVVVGGDGGVGGGGGGGSLGSRRFGGTEPPGFLKRRQPSASPTGRISGVASSAGSSQERIRIVFSSLGLGTPSFCGICSKCLTSRVTETQTTRCH